jgi:predicted nucleic acid-binding protein
MLLSEIPAGSRLLCDANVMVYGMLQAEPFAAVCRAFLERAARREITVYIAASSAADVIHRAMVSEAITKFGLEPRKAVSYLKAHPKAVRELQQYRKVLPDLTRFRVMILDVTYREIHGSRRHRDDHGLLTADSLLLAVMARHKLRDLATNDEDFQRVPGIRVWAPD